MDPLTLLRELFGEEPIRKVVTSGFDSVHKIAAATPESLAFFAGINEAVARQIVISAGESISGPPSTAYRSALAGSEEPAAAEEEPVLPVQPRAPRPSRPRGDPMGREPFDPLDDSPLLDAGGILKSVAQEPRPKELLDVEDLLEEVGLTDAEASFLEGISPWPGGEPPRRERSSPVPLEVRVSSLPSHTRREEEKEVEYAPISDWSPEQDPNPVPRLVRAPELGPGPAGEEEAVVPVVFGQPEPASAEPLRETSPAPEAEAAPREEAAQLKAQEPPSFWRFGK